MYHLNSSSVGPHVELEVVWSPIETTFTSQVAPQVCAEDQDVVDLRVSQVYIMWSFDERLFILSPYIQMWWLFLLDIQRKELVLFRLFRNELAKYMIFLVVSECSHYKRVRCENVERQGETAGALLSVRKGSSCSPPSKLSTLLLASNSQTDWHASATRLWTKLQHFGALSFKNIHWQQCSKRQHA